MKKIFVFIILCLTFNSFASELLCDGAKNIHARLKYEGKSGSLTISKEKEKIYQCQISFIEEKFNLSDESTRGAEIKDFIINDCVAFKEELKKEIKMSEGGFLKIHSSSESFLKFADNLNTIKCKTKK